MKFYFNVASETIKKISKYELFLIGMILLDTIITLSSYSSNEIIETKRVSFFYTVPISQIGGIYKLMMLYDIFLYIYMSYYFLNYEKLHSTTNIMVRANSKKTIVHKFFIGEALVILLSVIYYLIVYLGFREYAGFESVTLCNLIIYNSAIISTVMAASYTKNNLAKFVLVITGTASLIFYNLFATMGTIILLWIIIFFTFDIRTMTNC